MNELLLTLQDNKLVIGIAVSLSSAVTLFLSHVSKSKLQKEIESLRQHNAISENTFQELFQQRIELYRGMSECFEQYHSDINVAYPHWYDIDGKHDNYNTSFFKLSDGLKTLIKPNQILISTELSNRYHSVFEMQSPYLKKIYHLQSEGESWLEDIIELREKTEKEVLEIYTIVKKDIVRLRGSLAGEF